MYHFWKRFVLLSIYDGWYLKPYKSCLLAAVYIICLKVIKILEHN